MAKNGKNTNCTPARITMHQIAESAGVSIGTVSNVINGSLSVRENLRQRVLGVIRASDTCPTSYRAVCA